MNKHNRLASRRTFCAGGKVRSIAALLFGVLLSAAAFGQANQGREAVMSELVGSWSGVLAVAGQRITTVLNVTASGDDLAATMDSPDQGAFGIPVASVVVAGSTITFNIAAVAARYEATITEDGTLSGTFYQSGLSIPLEMEKVAAEAAGPPARPQDPQPPFPYEVADVVFRNREDQLNFAGTITYPRGSGPFPAVVLVSGSGQQNRDEEIYNHRPFLVLADALTRAGFAVLRYDDRGVGGSEGLETLGTATMYDFARDAAAAVDSLASRPGVDVDRIGVIGHSEGASIAAELAASNPHVSFAVLLAMPGVPGDDLMIQQWTAILEASGANQAVIGVVTDVWRRVYDRVLADGPVDQMAEDVRPILQELGTSPDQLNAQVIAITSPQWIGFLSYDPRPVLRRIDVPVLALTGSLDTQVPAGPNLLSIRQQLRAAPTNRYLVRELPGLNHLMQTATTGSPQEYASIEETFAPQAIDTIVTWLNANVR
jgi:pimeloyl-ACP methyl ester carboxylesterase